MAAVGRWPSATLDGACFPILQEAAAHELWDEAIVDQLSTAVVRQARDTGALAGLPRALVFRAGVHLLAGEFTTAATLIEEANSIAAATDHHRAGEIPLAVALRLAGCSGRCDQP